MLKICGKCQIEKPFDSFYNDTKRKDGKYPNCKICHNIYVRDRHIDPIVKEKHQKRYLVNRKNPDFIIKSNRRSAKFYQTVIGRAKTLLNNARKSSVAKLYDCNVTLEHIVTGIEKGFCPVTGIAFDLSNIYQNITGRKINPFAPSIDRIDSNVGYTNENTRIVIWQFNVMKGELTDCEIFSLLKAINNVQS